MRRVQATARCGARRSGCGDGQSPGAGAPGNRGRRNRDQRPGRSPLGPGEAGGRESRSRGDGAAALLYQDHGPVGGVAHRGAVAILEQQLDRQAAMLSYNDAWMLLLLLFLVVTPAILLLRKQNRRSGSPMNLH